MVVFVFCVFFLLRQMAYNVTLNSLPLTIFQLAFKVYFKTILDIIIIPISSN